MVVPVSISIRILFSSSTMVPIYSWTEDKELLIDIGIGFYSKINVRHSNRYWENWGYLSEVYQDGQLIWLPWPNSCLVELIQTTMIGEKELVIGMLVMHEAVGSELEWDGNGGVVQVTELVETPRLKGGLTLFLVFGTRDQSSCQYNYEWY